VSEERRRKLARARRRAARARAGSGEPRVPRVVDGLTGEPEAFEELKERLTQTGRIVGDPDFREHLRRLESLRRLGRPQP
jgi:hypothetical protein